MTRFCVDCQAPFRLRLTVRPDQVRCRACSRRAAARPIAERLWEKVDKTGTHGCWLWTASLNANGYGRINAGGRNGPALLAHRVVYELVVGPVPEGLELDHLFRVRRCVNPAHLEAVTRRTNQLRGYGPAGNNARKTHCSQGHEYTPDNIYRWRARPNNRYCRTCVIARVARYQRRLREAAAA